MKHRSKSMDTRTLTLIGCVLASLLPYTESRGAKPFDRPMIPIGGIFDEMASRSDVQPALSMAIHDINKDRSMPFSIDANTELNVPIHDSYSLISSACTKMKKGVFSLFSTTDVRTISTIMSYADALHMPLFSPSLPVNETNQVNGYTFFMRPLYAKALVHFIKHVGWRVAYYLYDDLEGLWFLQHLYDALNEEEMDVRIHVRRVTNDTDAYVMIKEVDKEDSKEFKKFILHLPTATKNKLFTSRSLITDASKGKYHFLIAGLDIEELDLRAYINGGINITGYSIIDKETGLAEEFVEELRKQRVIKRDYKLSSDVALMYDSVQIFTKALGMLTSSKPNHKIISNTLRGGYFYNNQSKGVDCFSDVVTPWVYGKKLRNAIQDTTFMGLTGRIAFNEFGLRRNYALDLYEVSIHRGLSKISSWNEYDGMKTQAEDHRRTTKNLRMSSNKTRIVTSILTAPYLTVKEQKPGEPPLTGNDRYEGYCADLIKKLASIVEFDYKIIPVHDKKYGAAENGTWNGMVGEVLRHEADIAVAPLTITSARERVIDFSKPFMSLGISIMIKKPTKSAPAVFSFMYPLSYEIWMCIIFAYIGVSVVLFLVSRFSPFEWEVEENSDGPTATNKFTIFNSLWFSLGAFMQQGCDFEPRSVSGRIVGSVWWFFTLIMISSYTANLAAFLTVQRMQSPIESADDLARQTEIKYGTINSGSSKDFSGRRPSRCISVWWAFMSTAEPSVFVENNEDGLKKVRDSDGKYAFLTESTNINYMNQRQPCDTMKVGSNLDSKGYGVGTPLGSDLRDLITLGVLTLREQGFLQTLETKWWFERGQCGEDLAKSKDSTTALSLDNVAGCFYILAGGLSVALLISLLEFIYKSKVESRRRQTPFGEAMKSKATLSLKGRLETQTTSYAYAPAAQLISLDGFADNNTHTQV